MSQNVDGRQMKVKSYAAKRGSLKNTKLKKITRKHLHFLSMQEFLMKKSYTEISNSRNNEFPTSIQKGKNKQIHFLEWLQIT